VRRLRGRIPSSAPITFGGVLDLSTARGFLARRMAQGDLAGDYRDPDRIRAWADRIAGTLAGHAPPAPQATR
jgi:menaquinone-dependent protoporphyrinogen oxidase